VPTLCRSREGWATPEKDKVKIVSTRQVLPTRLDDEVLELLRSQVERAEGGNYRTLINECLRRHVESSKEPFEKSLRRVIREEMRHVS